VAKAIKSKVRGIQRMWKVTRQNMQSVDIAADTLGVLDGDLVFSTRGITVRVIPADSYIDAELVSALEPYPRV
jgi:hypothetical protein